MSRWSERKQDKVEKQSKADQKKHNIDPDQAYCTECHEGYDASKPSQVNRHAH